MCLCKIKIRQSIREFSIQSQTECLPTGHSIMDLEEKGVWGNIRKQMIGGTKWIEYHKERQLQKKTEKSIHGNGNENQEKPIRDGRLLRVGVALRKYEQSSGF